MKYKMESKNINLNIGACKKHDITLPELLCMLIIISKTKGRSLVQSLLSKGLITGSWNNTEFFDDLVVTEKGDAIISSVIIDSTPYKTSDEELISLAQCLREIFPKGKKPGTNLYWSEGTPIIVKRLKLFFKKYGEIYTQEQIIKATKKYVESFNGNYSFMKLLKYFIFKEKVGLSGDVEGDSELINYIENYDDESLKQDWTISLI